MSRRRSEGQSLVKCDGPLAAPSGVMDTRKSCCDFPYIICFANSLILCTFSDMREETGRTKDDSGAEKPNAILLR
jgi:hypothetical protein